MKPGEVVPAKDFISRISESLPVLDQGIHRLAVEEKLDHQAIQLPSGDQISPSMTRALLSLRASEEIKLESRSDADAIVPIGLSGVRPDLRFSHVVRAGASL
jgi:hypothetical protein